MLLERGIFHRLDEAVVAFVGVKEDLVHNVWLGVWLLDQITPGEGWIHVYEGLYELNIFVFIL